MLRGLMCNEIKIKSARVAGSLADNQLCIGGFGFIRRIGHLYDIALTAVRS